MLFCILSTDYKWLRQKPKEWENWPDYLEMREFVRTVKVTNNEAKQGSR